MHRDTDGGPRLVGVEEVEVDGWEVGGGGRWMYGRWREVEGGSGGTFLSLWMMGAQPMVREELAGLL